jgi:hypothetical protein
LIEAIERGYRGIGQFSVVDGSGAMNENIDAAVLLQDIGVKRFNLAVLS